MRWLLENAQPSDLRAQDVLAIIRLHMDYVKVFEVDRDSTGEDDWTEEDDAEIADIIKEIDELEDLKKENSEEDPGDEDSESDPPDETG